MSEDIVQRLREWADNEAICEAIDTISALRARVEQLKQALADAIAAMKDQRECFRTQREPQSILGAHIHAAERALLSSPGAPQEGGE